MNKETFIEKYETELKNKKGQFLNAQWKSEKVVNGETYTKVSKGIVRLVQYGHINGVEVKGKSNPNEKVLIENTLYENTNTKSVLVQLATTDKKSMVSYYINGKETDKTNYEMVIKPRPNQEKPVVFRVRVENLISIGEWKMRWAITSFIFDVVAVPTCEGMIDEGSQNKYLTFIVDMV